MSITPNEVYTMKKPIQRATGDVLVCGLGLGYFVYKCLLKEDVKSITVIEKDKEIIDLFTKYILPKFPNNDKVTIIHSDIFEYNNFKDKDYDYSFVDIWRTPLEIDLYIKSKRLFNSLDNIKIKDFWIEDSFMEGIRDIIGSIILGHNLTFYDNSNILDIFDRFKDFKDISILLYKAIKKRIRKFGMNNTISYLSNISNVKDFFNKFIIMEM